MNTVPNSIRFSSIYFVINVHGKLFKNMIAKHLEFPFSKFDLFVCSTIIKKLCFHIAQNLKFRQTFRNQESGYLLTWDTDSKKNPDLNDG